MLGTLRSNPFNQFPEAACSNRDYAVPDALKPPTSSASASASSATNTLCHQHESDTKPYYQTHIYGPPPSMGPMGGFMLSPQQRGGYPMPTFHPQLQHQMQHQNPPVETPYDVTEILKNTHIQGVSG